MSFAVLAGGLEHNFTSLAISYSKFILSNQWVILLDASYLNPHFKRSWSSL